MWRKSFVKSKPNIYKNVGFLPVSKSISKSRQAYNVMTNNLNHFKQIVDDAWIRHSKDLFRAPTAHDIEILIQTCLMPLSIKTQSDSLTFVHELKQEMHADLKYVETLEKEIDELESDKAEFSDIYHVILQECVSKDVMCSYLMSLSDLDALDELQCLYLHKVKECDCLTQKLSNQTKTVSKEVHNELLRRFSKIEKHSISLEIALQKRKEQKLIEKGKGKSADTKFDRPSVVRQPNAQRISKPSVLGKPTPFSNSLYRMYFQKTESVPKANVSEGLSKPDTAQTLPQTMKKAVSNTNVLKPGMYRIDNRTSHTRAPQLPQTVRNANPCVSTSIGVNHKPTVSRPPLKSNQSRDKVAFRKSTCFVRDLQGNDLLVGNRGSDLYTISLQESTSLNPLCLMAKATPTQAWLWHQRLSHLNFDYINLLLKKDIMIGLPKLKYVASINGKKYILVIVDDYSRYTWTLFLCSKDETPEVGTDFLNKTLNAFFKEEGIEHQTSTAQTPEQNGVVERWNRTLVEAARTMLSASQLPLFF
nr:hypothetical protein [Tanacetum cinerariifolium]